MSRNSISTLASAVEMEFRDIYDTYFDILEEHIPEDRRGNFQSMKLDILQNHLTAYLNHRNRLETPGYRNLVDLPCENKGQYVRLIGILIYKTFYLEAGEDLVHRLDGVVAEFFRRLERYYLHLLEETGPTVVGLSVCIGMMAASLFAFKLTKERYPHIKTVMGGGIYADDLALGSSNLAYFAEKTPYIDTLIVGEGELLFLKYLRGELPPDRKIYSINDLGTERLDLAAVSIPSFDDFKLDRYPYLSANASVGCPFNCKFCTIPEQWGKYRKKKPKQLAAELNRMYRKYGSQLFLLVDSLLNPIVTGLARELIDSPTPLYWDGSLRVSPAVCDTDNTFLWRKGGFYRAHLGVETGSQRVLDLMDKGITVDQIRTAVSALARAGVKTTTFWVVGYPGETEEDFLQSLRLTEELKDDLYETTIRPYLYYEMKEELVGPPREEGKSVLLYPPETKEKLLVETRVMETEPSREETVRRLNRFNAHIQALGIPNPYSLYQVNRADKRWKELHENAVPPLVAFKEKNTRIDECRYVEKPVYLQRTMEDEDEEFGF